MEEIFSRGASGVAVLVEAGAALIILIGALEALYATFATFFTNPALGTRRQIWRHFAVWLLLGLEFELAADIIRSAIAPNWTDIGQLAAIAAIRTFLNYFLERDIDSGIG